MRIALVGYGKMGKEIEKVIIEKGYSVSHRISRSSKDQLTDILPDNTDVVIEFTSPDSAYQHVKYCIETGIPVVCGSTGWHAQKVELEKLTLEKNASFFWASNFSIGVNLFFEINAYAAKLMQKYLDYDVSITEIHHTQKKDTPSGTAITLAEQIVKNHSQKKTWKLVDADAPYQAFSPRQSDAIPITAVRKEDVKGTHTAYYTSDIDTISLTHEAHSRIGFAKGAVWAAEFIRHRKGVFGMKDLLALQD